PTIETIRRGQKSERAGADAVSTETGSKVPPDRATAVATEPDAASATPPRAHWCGAWARLTRLVPAQTATTRVQIRPPSCARSRHTESTESSNTHTATRTRPAEIGRASCGESR